MTDAATTLANHAVALLGVSMLVVLLHLGAVIVAFRLARRHADHLRPALTRLRPWVPARRVAMHLALGFIAIVALFIVVTLARQITPGSTVAQFDLAFAKALDESTTPGWRRFFQYVTLAGTGSALGIASTLVGAYLLLRRQFVLVAGWAVTQGGAVVLVKVIKAMVERTRPGLGDPTFWANGWSFPSGHVVRTFAFCVMGAYLVWRLTRSWRATAAVLALAGICSLVMAFSRLYLGAHFASDVTAGLIVATAWVAVCISVTEEALRYSEARTARRMSG